MKFQITLPLLEELRRRHSYPETAFRVLTELVPEGSEFRLNWSYLRHGYIPGYDCDWVLVVAPRGVRYWKPIGGEPDWIQDNPAIVVLPILLLLLIYKALFYTSKFLSWIFLPRGFHRRVFYVNRVYESMLSEYFID